MEKYTEILKKYKIKIEYEEENLRELPERDPKIITFYAEKGGVGKTTMCLTLAYKFAEDGKRVLIYDCDVQRSLTAWAFGTNIECDHSNSANRVDHFIDNPFYPSKPVRPKNFKVSLYQQVTDDEEIICPAFAIKLVDNLYIVPGDRKLPDLDTIIINNETISTTNVFGVFPNNKSAKPYYSILATAKYYKADFVFLDLNPYPGVLNRCLIMSSHYIVMPVCLDFFCLEMTHMISDNLKKWYKKTNEIKASTRHHGGKFPWPEHLPKFMGYILNMFMVNNLWGENVPIQYKNLSLRTNERFLAEMIDNEVKKITQNLGDSRPYPLAIQNEIYKKCKLEQNLGFITEFYGLGDIANLFHIPVPFLNELHFYKFEKDRQLFSPINSKDSICKMKDQIRRFNEMYTNIMNNILTLIECDSMTPKKKRKN